MHKMYVGSSVFSGACCSVLQVAGERLNLEIWTTDGLSVTRTATSFLLVTSHMTSMRASSKSSSWVCFLKKSTLVYVLLQKKNFTGWINIHWIPLFVCLSCSIWKCCGAADQHKGCWWEIAQLWICSLWWLWSCAKNSGGQGRRGMY